MEYSKRPGVDPERCFDVIAHVETLVRYRNGGALQLNKVRYGGNNDRIVWDIRRFRMTEDGKLLGIGGISLYDKELAALKKALEDICL